MNFSTRTSLLLSLCIFAVLSCSSPKEIEYRDYRNFGLTKLGFNKSMVKLDLQYYNPNNFGLQLRRTELDIYVNNSLLGQSTSDSLIHIPRRDTFTIPIKFEVDMANLLKNAVITMFNKEVAVKVTGKVKVGKGNVFMSYPVNYVGNHTFSLF